MRDRPILFAGPMVRAILEGRKTMTRRVVKGAALDWLDSAGFTPQFVADPENYLCPYGQHGDRLWVRETFFEEINPLTSQRYNPPKYQYRATCNDEVILDDGDGFATVNKDGTFASPWKPSIHMPRRASRITLEITAVRVERLQDIDDGDAQWEGCEPDDDALKRDIIDFVPSFRRLWDSINLARGYGWDANPWVWVIEFKPATPSAEGGEL